MSNTRLFYDFWTDEKMTSFTSESGNMPAENLGYGSPAIVWRSAYVAPPNPIPDQEFIYDLGVNRPIDCLFLYNTNITYSGKLKFTIAADAAFTDVVFYKEWNVVSPIHGFGEGPFGLIPFGGYAKEQNNFNFFVKYLESVYVGRYIKIIFSDPLNSNGFLEVGRLGVGQYWEPQYNVAWGEALSLQIESKAAIMRSGAINVQKLPQARGLSATFNYLSQAEAYKIISINYKVGRSKDVFISQFPEGNTTYKRLFSMLAKITDFSGISRNNPLFSSASFNFRESL